MKMLHVAGAWMRDHLGAASWSMPPLGHVGPESGPPSVLSNLPPRVLLVDDSEVNRLLAREQLLRWGVEPTLACDGAQAVDLATSRAFDLVLMDVSMPVMDGLEATERIRRHELAHPERARVTIVAYTAGTAVNDPAAQARHGLDGVLQKPCSTRKIGECLQQWCAISLD